MLEEAGFQLALDLDAAIGFLDFHDDGGVRPAQQFRHNHAGLGVTVVVRLQAGEDEIELFIFNRGDESFGHIEGVQADKAVIFQMNGAIRALGQPFPQHLLRTRGPGGDDYDFAGVLFFLAQSLFQGEGVRLIDFIGDVVADPCAAFIEFERRVFLRDLLHADQNLHIRCVPVQQLRCEFRAVCLRRRTSLVKPANSSINQIARNRRDRT